MILAIRDYILQKIETNSNNLTNNVSDAISTGISNGLSKLWDKFLISFNGSIDTIAIIGIMSTWMLNMMSVPSAGKWCYTIFALYIVIKVVLKVCLLN